MISEIVTLVRKDLGAVAAFRLVAQVKALPRTRYVKVMMKMAMTMRMGKGLDNVIAFGRVAHVNTLPKTIRPT